MRLLLSWSLIILSMALASLSLVLSTVHAEPLPIEWRVQSGSFSRGIQKIKVDGSIRRTILEGNWKVWFVDEFWIYFSLDTPEGYATIFRISLNGTNLDQVPRDKLPFDAEKMQAKASENYSPGYIIRDGEDIPPGLIVVENNRSTHTVPRIDLPWRKSVLGGLSAMLLVMGCIIATVRKI